MKHRRHYADDPTLCDRVFDLLDTWIPALRGMRDRSAALGSRWEAVSTPFVHERDGRIVSHVGVLELPLVCRGEVHTAGGIHAVCTLASERRQGLYRALMEEVLAHCDARYDVIELTTEHPEYYAPFGFRHVPEHRFLVRTDSAGGGGGLRRLDLTQRDDLERLDALLDRRAPVSRSLGVVREHAVFKFNLSGGLDVHYSERLDAALVLQHPSPGRLELLDVIAPEIPPLRALLDEMPAPVREVRCHFLPDQLDVQAEPEPVSGDFFMLRGHLPLPLDSALGMLSPLARH